MLGHHRHLPSEPLGYLRCAHAHDCDLTLEVGVVDPVVQAAPLERVMDFARPVPGEDHQRWMVRADGAELPEC